MVALCLLFSPAVVAKNPINEGKLSGAFIQFDDESFTKSRNDLNTLVEGMHKNGLRSLVIQFVSRDIWNLKMKPPTFVKSVDFMDGQRDFIEEVLSIADDKDISVHVGLPYSDKWLYDEELFFIRSRFALAIKLGYDKAVEDRDAAIAAQASPEKIQVLTRDAGKWKEMYEAARDAFEELKASIWTHKDKSDGSNWVEVSVRKVARIEEKYKNHKSFSGLYIPQEIPNRKFNDDELNTIAGGFRRIADAEKAISPTHDISFSPYLAEPEAAPATPEETEKLFTSFIKTSGVKSMMPQDSVGLHKLESREDIERVAIPFLKACNAACATTDTKILPITECWRKFGENDYRACSIERLLIQLELESALLPNASFTAFDLNHHLNPNGKAEAKALREAVDKLHTEQ